MVMSVLLNLKIVPVEGCLYTQTEYKKDLANVDDYVFTLNYTKDSYFYTATMCVYSSFYTQSVGDQVPWLYAIHL